VTILKKEKYQGGRSGKVEKKEKSEGVTLQEKFCGRLEED